MDRSRIVSDITSMHCVWTNRGTNVFFWRMRWSDDDGLHQAVITWTGVTRSGQDGSRCVRIVPSIVFDHVSQFNNEFSLLVLLRCFESMLILPSKGSFATGTMDISHCMKSSQKNPFLCRTTANIDNGVEKVCPSLAPLEWFGNQLVVVSKVGSTVDTWINAMRIGRKVGLKSLHHDDFFSLVCIESWIFQGWQLFTLYHVMRRWKYIHVTLCFHPLPYDVVSDRITLMEQQEK